ncbi:E3 SUMO-protein ligase ZBED1-like [Galleria mellonella]|uniref:E3 SUMO-protein ligase ZBED1-like n=1 Tax=Galleria mellonella TaxID=7137 RepID=A0ABM3MS76_GALME|nr:E3 SUMO-protein ligase ZBED1-like [Galleria mellonella]
MSPPKKSVVWEFFRKNSDDSGTRLYCKLCNCNYKYIGNTSTLINHLKKKHIVQYSEAIGQALPSNETVSNGYEENSRIFLSSNRPEPSSSENRILPSPSLVEIPNDERLTEPTQKRMRQMRITAPTKINQKSGNDALMDMIVLDLQPLQIVENKGFIKYTQTLNPHYEIPSRKKLTQMLEDRYLICSTELKEKLKDVLDIALTTDIWSSDSQKSFISVTAHFIQYSKLRSMVISTKELPEQHTAENIANILRTILSDWKIYDKIVTVVTDNASNMKKAVNDYLNKRNHFCIAHTINLAVKDCLGKEIENIQSSYLKNTEILNVITKCRNIVTHFKQSTKSANTLRDMQTQMNLEILKLKQDINTRWNSTFYMLERLLRLKIPLSATLPLLDTPPLNLNSAEWSILEDCVAVLRPLEKITTTLSGEYYPTLSYIIPLVRGLQNSILKKTPHTEAGQHLQQSLLEVIDRRLGVYEGNRTAAKATILDPRFKKKAFGLESAAENAIKYVIEELAQYQLQLQVSEIQHESNTATTSQTQTSSNSDDELWEVFDKKVNDSTTQQTPISSASIMLKQYLDAPYLDRKKDPLQFWEERKHIFPSLYRMACKYLCIPATSVPSERLFSKAGLLTNQRRNRLLPKKLDQILFLNSVCREKKISNTFNK